MAPDDTDVAPPVDRSAAAVRGRGSARVDLWYRVSPIAIPTLVTVAVVIVSSILFPSSLSFSGLSTLTPLIGVLIIASIGQALVIGTGGIDLSASAVMTLAGITFVRFSDGDDDRLVWGLVAAVVVGLVCGLVNGLAVEYFGLSPLVTTLATGQMMLGLATLWYQGGANNLPLPESWAAISGGGVFGVSYTFILGIVLAFVWSVLLASTVGGRRLAAASTARMTSVYQGIRVQPLRATTYVVAAMFYTVAGLLLAGAIGTTPTLSLGAAYQLSTIVAVVLGGAALAGGRVRPGAVLAGALLLAFISQDVQIAGWPQGIQAVVQGVILILAMLVGSVRGIRWFRSSRGVEKRA